MNELSQCLLQERGPGSPKALEAMETSEGLYIYEVLPHGDPAINDDDDLPTHFEGRLSHEAWRTLVLMYAMRHPEAFAPIVAKWQALERRGL